ncbi:hypothetical protein AJ79_02288 [Helicocarpus griseus UAMH5409]|uniref:Transcription factor domain-containing protein n=1 Tax=Helicocarpus griseus UAMH5409 TaxID=1447875 RepID=A0A2B7XV96_9EURO|nr:hypothetical protein AJ79_02288 [Helicocarpus griseus UAMH5409]
MPPKTRRTRPAERRGPAASARADSEAKPNGIFHFVSVNPSSELQKSENRSVIRSHASKYIWRQHRAVRTDGNNFNPSSSKHGHSPIDPIISPNPLHNATDARPWALTPDPVNGEDALSTYSPTEGSVASSSDTDREIEGPVKPASIVNHRDDERKNTPYQDSESVESNMAAAADLYEHESNTIAGRPFNQLMDFISNPGHSFPSMLGESAISKLMRYAAFDLWPGLVLGAGNKKWDHEAAAQNWLPRAMSNPALFTAFMYGAAGHLQTRKRLESAHVSPQTREEKLEQIICESETIKQLNKMMLDPQQLCTDEVILAVLCMAFNKIDYSSWNADAESAPKAPLRNLQWLDVYGGLSLNDQHVKGLFALIHTRGGLDKLTMPGLAETLSTSAIMLSTKYIAKPRLPFVPIFKESATGQTPKWPHLASNTNPMAMSMIDLSSNIEPPFSPPDNSDNYTNDPSWDRSTNTNTNRNRNSNLKPADIFTNSNLPHSLTAVLRNMQNYNAVVTMYTQGLLPYLELPVIADRRNWIQYELLSLKSINELSDATQDTTSSPSNSTHASSKSATPSPTVTTTSTSTSQHSHSHPHLPNYNIYEPTRLAAMIYSMLVVFPLPAANRPFPRLCRMTKAALIAADIESISPVNPHFNPQTSCWSGATDVLFWVLMLGAMAARNTPSEEWFVERARDARLVYGVRSWKQIKGIVEGVMWMDCVCDFWLMGVWGEIGGEW